ncbi:MAG TPA: AAA family ATPase [Bacilli bacterium]|nr:AAA family ATPase [Bacilli bacterium]
MAQRYLSIKDYRNVGITKEQSILLNTSIKEGEMGNLVVVVGPNNSGKSNCLDALMCIGDHAKLTKGDIPDFENQKKTPEISLSIKDDTISTGQFVKLTDKGLEAELYYEEKGKDRKTKSETNLYPSKEAQQFFINLLANMPMKEINKPTLTQHDKEFGMIVLRTISNHWGTHVHNTFDGGLNTLIQRNDIESIMNRRDKIFPKVFNYLEKNWGSEWHRNVGHPTNQLDNEKVAEHKRRLCNKYIIRDISLSKPSVKLISEIQAKFNNDTVKIEYSDKQKKFAIDLLNKLSNAIQNYNSSKSAETKDTSVSDETMYIYETYTNQQKIPDMNIYFALVEATNIIVNLEGPKFIESVLQSNIEAFNIQLREFDMTAVSHGGSNLLIDIDYKKYQKEIREILTYAQDRFGKDYQRKIMDTGISTEELSNYSKQLTTQNETITSPEIIEFQKTNNIALQPTIIRFVETEINRKSLTETPSNLKSSHFFSVLFKAINYDQNELTTLYADIKSGTKVLANLRITENTINKKLEKVSEQFNRLFFQSHEKYCFRLMLESERIEFSIYIGEIPLNLDKQSTGFRWFFNFYFTVIAQKGLKRGDIVIMDEPATNLHVSGIQELRSFIKDYAKKSEITFVISTHSPFFIDMDHIEEIRVVSRKDGEAVVNNKFQVIEDDDTDALRPIKDALTVGRHVLIDTTKKTIFVEGITDYCYLTAFKKHIDEAKGFYFLPIQGLKKEGIIEKILKIDRNPTILVDSDHYGNGLKKIAENPKYKDVVEVIKLDEIDKAFTDIESLFVPKDCPERKSFNHAVAFKNKCNVESVDKITFNNFKKVFENICS